MNPVQVLLSLKSSRCGANLKKQNASTTTEKKTLMYSGINCPRSMH